MDKTDESFGQKLRGRRRQRALTQAGLADMLGVAEKTVGKMGTRRSRAFSIQHDRAPKAGSDRPMAGPEWRRGEPTRLAGRVERPCAADFRMPAFRTAGPDGRSPGRIRMRDDRVFSPASQPAAIVRPGHRQLNDHAGAAAGMIERIGHQGDRTPSSRLAGYAPGKGFPTPPGWMPCAGPPATGSAAFNVRLNVQNVAARRQQPLRAAIRVRGGFRKTADGPQHKSYISAGM